MRPPIAAAAYAALAAGLTAAALGAGAQASDPDPASRTALERWVLQDQQAVGELASPPFAVSRVRCLPARGFCEVTRTVQTRDTYAEYVRWVSIIRTTQERDWRFTALPVDQAARLAAAREGRLRSAISTTWSGAS
jgi:hypothetical protein